MDVEKGPYSADKGDFATAGAVNITTRDIVDHSSVSAEGGTFGTGRVLGISRAADWRVFIRGSRLRCTEPTGRS